MCKPVNHYGVIYCGRNTANNKLYIGQTTSTLDTRKLNHKSRPPNVHLQRAFKKYGFNAFAWTILAYAYSQEELDYLETKYIRELNTTDRHLGYNCKEGGANGRLSEDTKLRISISKMGTPLSGSHKSRISETKKGKQLGSLNPNFGNGTAILGTRNPMYGRKHSEESKTKMSIGKRANPTRLTGERNGMYGRLPTTACIVIAHCQGRFIGKFRSIREAASHLNISQPFAARLATGKRVSRAGITIAKCGGPERIRTFTPFGTRS